MKLTGNLQTIVPLDCGEHGQTVTGKARYYAPGAIVELWQCGEGTSIDYQQAKRFLKVIADKPGRITIVVLAWGLPGWIGETIPPWASDPDKGMEAELKAVTEKGIVVVAAAGDDSQGGKIGANYPACSPYCIPAMGCASFCNRTKRGLVCTESSSSRAAAELAGAIAMIREAGGSYQVLLDNSSDDSFPCLLIGGATEALGAEPDYNPPIEKYSWQAIRTGKVKVTVDPPTKIIRYKSDGTRLRERHTDMVTEEKSGNKVLIGVMNGGSVTFRRAA